jgi:hypothetical protein
MSDEIQFSEPPEYVDKIGAQVVDAAFKVHDKWGPGLLEHFYKTALFNELVRR